MNYQTCSLEDLTDHIDNTIHKIYLALEDSPISRGNQINSNIGFYMGVCEARGFDYDSGTIIGWSDLTIDIPVND